MNLLSARDIARLSLWGTVGEASTSRCLGRVPPSEGNWVSPMTLLLPAFSRRGSHGKARAHGKGEKGRGTGASDTSSAVSNLIHSISQFINVCAFSLPNLTAS